MQLADRYGSPPKFQPQPLERFRGGAIENYSNIIDPDVVIRKSQKYQSLFPASRTLQTAAVCDIVQHRMAAGGFGVNAPLDWPKKCPARFQVHSPPAPFQTPQMKWKSARPIAPVARHMSKLGLKQELRPYQWPWTAPRLPLMPPPTCAPSQIQIFVPRDVQLLIRISKLRKWLDTGRILLSTIPQSLLRDMPNLRDHLLKTVEFWEQCAGDKVLLFQLDSVMCSNSQRSVLCLCHCPGLCLTRQQEFFDRWSPPTGKVSKRKKKDYTYKCFKNVILSSCRPRVETTLIRERVGDNLRIFG